MKKTLMRIAAFAVASALLLSGCTGKSSTDSSAELTSINVSHHPYIHGLPSYVATEQGIYEKYGLDPQITMYAGGPAQNEACATNAWDVGTTGMAGAVLGCIGYDMKIIGTSASESATVDIWVRPDSPIASITGAVEGCPDVKGDADSWRGKTIICQSATNCQLVLLGTLEKMGLTLDDVNIIDMAVAHGYPAFKAGEADMVCLWSPFGYQAEAEGWVKVSSAEAVGLEFYNVIIATDKAIKEMPDAVQRWMDAYQEGADYITAHSDEAGQWLYDFSMDEGITTTLENSELDIKYRPFPTAEQQKEMMSDGSVQEQLTTFAEFLKNQGNITQADYDKLASGACIDPTFVEGLE